MNKKPYSKDNFIKTFVNQMYGILIGIGIGSILFASDFDPSLWFNIVMVLFVTGVVVIYWWDWIEYIEKEIISAKSELMIDFAILITLEMLFVYYNRPSLLAFAFIVLSLCDLLWVLNHIRLNQTYKKESKSNACNKKWIFEKLTSSFIYLLLWISMLYIIPTLTSPFDQILTVIFFIGAFVIVRKVSFRQVKKSSVYEIRKAGDLDVSAILSINHSYFNDGSLILLKKYNIKEIVALVRDERILVAINSQGTLVGYLVTAQNGALNYLKDTVFKDETVKLELKKSQHVLLEQIAVDKEMTGTGIGSLLIQDFIQKANQPILSFVAVEPFNNDTSIKFHEANHFIHVGDFSRDVFMDRENYVSYLYMFER